MFAAHTEIQDHANRLSNEIYTKRGWNFVILSRKPACPFKRWILTILNLTEQYEDAPSRWTPDASAAFFKIGSPQTQDVKQKHVDFCPDRRGSKFGCLLMASLSLEYGPRGGDSTGQKRLQDIKQTRLLNRTAGYPVQVIIANAIMAAKTGPSFFSCRWSYAAGYAGSTLVKGKSSIAVLRQDLPPRVGPRRQVLSSIVDYSKLGISLAPSLPQPRPSNNISPWWDTVILISLSLTISK